MELTEGNVACEIWSETIRWPSVWIKTNQQNIEGIRSKGKKCNKSPARYRMGVWLKSNERIWLRTSAADKSSAIWLCKLYLRTAARGWDPISDVSFHFFLHNVYSFHIFIRFPSPRSFCSVFKSRGTMPLSAGSFAASRFLARGFFFLLLYLFYTNVYFYNHRLFFSLMLSTHKWLIRSPRVCWSNNM